MEIVKPALYLLGALLALSAGSLLLPRHISVERVALINSTPQAILALAASNEGYQAFNPYKSVDPDLKIDLFGPSSGVGSGFRFKGKDGSGSQTVAAVTANKVSYAIDLGALGKPQQSIQASPTANGTEVTWRMENDTGFNPIFRVFGLFADGMLGATLERGLQNLATASG